MKRIRRSILLPILAALLCTAVFAANKPSSALESLKPQLAEAIENRMPYLTVPAEGLEQFSDEQLMVDLLHEIAAETPETSGSGIDYNVCNLHSVTCLYQNGKLTVAFSYLTTAAEEAEIDRACEQIRAGLDYGEGSDYEKLRAIYEYVGSHFTYDESLSTFSPYQGLKSGKMVCQGFAILLYKLLWQENIPNRILVGVGAGSRHGWNLVRLGEKWYNMDVTWDAYRETREMEWNCFLRGSKHFPSHFREKCYESGTFARLHPTDPENYRPEKVDVTLGGEPFVSLIMRTCHSATVGASVSGRKNLKFAFSSSDEGVASVTNDGVITAHTLGECEITVRCPELAAVPGRFRLRTVDLTAASPWALGGVNALYERGLLSFAFCSDFQKPLTREELCAMLCGMLNVYADPTAEISYTDLDGCRYPSSVLYISALGVTSGMGDGRFCPQGLLTREQLCKILCKIAALLGYPLTGNEPVSFDDAERFGAWSQEYVQSVVSGGVMCGTGGGCFSPKATVTREQFILTLERLICLTENEKR